MSQTLEQTLETGAARLELALNRRNAKYSVKLSNVGKVCAAESIAAADDYGISMVFNGRRHFKH